VKRHHDLWERVCSFDNIAAAAREAMRGKRGKAAGARFFGYWEQDVVRLERGVARRQLPAMFLLLLRNHRPEEEGGGGCATVEDVVALCRELNSRAARYLVAGG
jgi:hypothetical protein